ncbi:hypothetical protein [Escherichia coli]|nr:hypothetical protein [Escherichia coli]MCL7066841.1 hypothetical protein [Escherichia coli]MCL7221567.1 hypothetical protein [Escherichia coli]
MSVFRIHLDSNKKA